MDLLATDYPLQAAFGPEGDDQDIVAWYVQSDQSLMPNLSVTTGIRHARVDNDIDNDDVDVHLDDSVTVGSLGLSHRPNQAWRLFPLADQNYRYLKLNEQYPGSDFGNRSEPLDPYTAANLVVQRDLGYWRLSVRVNNLFDERYSEPGASSFAGDGFNPGPKRNFRIRAS
jgi:outer membrane receptor protein involved in Fe transport